ncbi:MAG: histidine kinase, partial [Nocardiopsaceae bacterium]|nr:histidine kinase [Nocardiopsaceae bacterium]
MSASEHGLVAGMRMQDSSWYQWVPGRARRVSPGFSPRADVSLPGPPDTGGMLRTVNGLARVLGFAWLGVLAFVIAPPSAPHALPFQIAGYAVLGLAVLAWTVLEAVPAAAARYPWALPVLRGVIAVSAGFVAGAGDGGSAMVVVAFVAAMAAGINSDFGTALAVTAAGILAIEVSGLAFGQSFGTLLGLPVVVLAGLVIGWNWGGYRVQAEQAAALLAQREQLQAEQRRADLLDERARIAREIHDVLAHSLGALGIQIQAARSVLRKDADQASDLLAAAQQMAAEGLVETRRAIQAMRTDTLPLNEELALVTDTHAQRYHVPVSYQTGGIPAALQPDATLALLRTAQEALVNAAKHAAGQPVSVRLDYGDADVRLTVCNDLPPDAETRQPANMSTVDG